MASSEFLNKSGLSYFFGKIKEMLQGKQDKLTAGNGIVIDDTNTISGEKNTFYGTCSTALNVQIKVVECEDWEDKEGNVLFVKFDNEPYPSGLNIIKIGDVQHSIYVGNSGFKTLQKWLPNEVVCFVLANNRFNLVSHQTATADNFGLVKITNTVASDAWGQTAAGIGCVYNLQQSVNNKQDKLTAGTGITIENNVISASSAHNLDLYLYRLQQTDTSFSGYTITLSEAGITTEYGGGYAWRIYVSAQQLLLPDIGSEANFEVMLDARFSNGTTIHNCVVPARITAFSETYGLTVILQMDGLMLCETRSSLTFTQYHSFSNQKIAVKATRTSVF